jgi:thiamine pyrophosphate-dependent acetolactate synthase large subunit-like protein
MPFGTDFANPDFSRVADALGARGIRIEEPGDVRAGLQAALSHKGGPVVVDVLVDWSSQGGLPGRVDHGQYSGLLVGLEALAE